MRQFAPFLLVLALPALAHPQSLGAAAQKEKERRQKNREAGVKPRVVTDEQMNADRPEASPSPSPGPATSPSPTPEPVSDTSHVRKQQESQWRARLGQVQARIEAARSRYERYSKMTIVSGEYYADAEGRPVITSVEQLQRLTAQAKAELESAEKALRDLDEDARRAGIPPGWLR